MIDFPKNIFTGHHNIDKLPADVQEIVAQVVFYSVAKQYVGRQNTKTAQKEMSALFWDAVKNCDFESEKGLLFFSCNNVKYKVCLECKASVSGGRIGDFLRHSSECNRELAVAALCAAKGRT